MWNNRKPVCEKKYFSNNGFDIGQEQGCNALLLLVLYYVLDGNDKSEHITHLDNVVRIIITWSGTLLLNLKTLVALKIKAAASWARENASALRRLFSFAVVRQLCSIYFCKLLHFSIPHRNFFCNR